MVITLPAYTGNCRQSFLVTNSHWLPRRVVATCMGNKNSLGRLVGAFISRLIMVSAADCPCPVAPTVVLYH